MSSTDSGSTAEEPGSNEDSWAEKIACQFTRTIGSTSSDLKSSEKIAAYATYPAPTHAPPTHAPRTSITQQCLLSRV